MINWTFSRFTDAPPLKTVQLLERFFSDLEIEEFQRFKIPKRKSEWLASRLLVKQLVQKIIATDMLFPLKAITFHKETSGVPIVMVDGLGRVGWLSISHSHDGVLAAFTQDRKVHFGADLEFIESRSLDLFADYFTPSEIAWIASSQMDKKDFHANLVWSAKEAYLKAIEKGLQMDTRKIEIHPSGESSFSKGWNRIGFMVEGFNSQSWQILYSRHQGFVMTICLPENQSSHLVEIEALPDLDY
ncbi:MAG: 4'-phosphopantetheinyl transferase family protein [Anaerolineaceae bacterium]